MRMGEGGERVRMRMGEGGERSQRQQCERVRLVEQVHACAYACVCVSIKGHL